MPVKGDEQAIELMNDSRYGLTASIWTSDAQAALSVGERPLRAPNPFTCAWASND